LVRASPPRRRQVPVPKQQIRIARSVCADPDWHKFVRRLCLMPEGPIPKKILSKRRLHKIWSASRDATSKPASAGIDGQSAQSFAQNLDAKIARLNSDISARKFGFSDLRAVAIPKDNGKKRIICIPTVRDRLVQRAIVTWLVETNKIPQQDFVYGTKGQGLKKAIQRALTLRSTFEWCVKTDSLS
jgi:RNA-directed DNA polymerase